MGHLLQVHKYLDGSIEGGADEEIAGEERETPDSAAVTSQHLRALAVFQTPDTDRLVATSGHQNVGSRFAPSQVEQSVTPIQRLHDLETLWFSIED